MRYGKVLADGGLRSIKEDVTRYSNVPFSYVFVIKYEDGIRTITYRLSEPNGFSNLVFKSEFWRAL